MQTLKDWQFFFEVCLCLFGYFEAQELGGGASLVQIVQLNFGIHFGLLFLLLGRCVLRVDKSTSNLDTC